MPDLARSPKQLGTIIRRQRKRLFQTGEKAGLSRSLIRKAVEDVTAGMDAAIAALEAELPADFPQKPHESVKNGIQTRMRVLQIGIRD